MKTPLHLLIALAAALALAASAEAKGRTTATIWGASGSVTVEGPQTMLLPIAAHVTGPPEVAAFYSINVRLGDYRPAQHRLMLWVPSARRAAGVGVMGGVEWFAVEASRARMLDAAVADLEPYQPGRAWPRRLQSVEQISALAGARVAPPAPVDGFRWTYVLAGLAPAAALIAALLLVVRRRRSAATAYLRPV